jgi:hypothetical protein
MKRMGVLLASVTLLGVFACLGAPGKLKAGELWAALTVSEPIVVAGKLNTLGATFALANDTDHPIDPQVASWRLIINGEEYADSQFLFGNGPQDERWKSLPAGDHLLFGYTIGDLFKKPGTYTLMWRGKDFESPQVTFRVLKQK